MTQTAEIFKGTPQDLAARLNTLIGGGSTIDIVLSTKDNGTYLIVHSS